MKTAEIDATLARVAEMNPAPDTALLNEDERAIAAANLHKITHQSPADAQSAVGKFTRARRRALVRRVGVAGLAGALTFGGATAATGVTPSGLATGIGALTATTPPMLSYVGANQSAADVLESIAGATADDFASTSSGEYRYVHWQAWSMRHGDGEPDRIAPVERWAWLADDGTARTHGIEDGRSKGYLDWPVGGYAVPMTERVVLTDNADAAAKALTGATSAEAADAYQLLDRYTQLAQIEGLGADASARVGFLRALAATDVVAYGQATDRAGRTGQAFGASWEHDGLRNEIRIVVDPATGHLLAKESILHGPWILGSTSTVVDYVTYLENNRTPTLPECGNIGCTTMPPPG